MDDTEVWEWASWPDGSGSGERGKSGGGGKKGLRGKHRNTGKAAFLAVNGRPLLCAPQCSSEQDRCVLSPEVCQVVNNPKDITRRQEVQGAEGRAVGPGPMESGEACFEKATCS